MGGCLTTNRDSAGTKMTMRQRRLSVCVEEDAILPDSRPGDVGALTQPGVEFSRIKVNQDAYLVNDNLMLYSVQDGHGIRGRDCSGYVRDRLGPAMEKRELSAEGVCEALVEIGDEMEADPAVDCRFSGTTVLVVMVSAETVVSAWLGDSRAVLVRSDQGELGIVELSRDHKPDIPAERKRILKAGGVIRQLKDENGKPAGPLRVFKPSSTVPGVNFSRSLGDQVIHKYGVSSEAQSIVQPRTPADRFIVVASDGIFEFLSNQQVTEIVVGCKTVDAAATELIRKARELWMQEEGGSDDCTVIVIKLA